MIVVVAGTATDIGKTWVTCRLIELTRAAGASVAARKPAQSFEAVAGSPVAPTDADLLAAATGETAEQVCPPHRWYPVPMAPPMAADVLGRVSFDVAELVAEMVWPDDVDLAIVETAGGVRSPIASDGDCVALATLLHPDLTLLVADARLGTISSVRLAVEALAPLETLVVLNRYEPDNDLHRRNLEWLSQRDGYHVLTDLAEVAARLRPPGPARG